MQQDCAAESAPAALAKAPWVQPPPPSQPAGSPAGAACRRQSPAPPRREPPLRTEPADTAAPFAEERVAPAMSALASSVGLKGLKGGALRQQAQRPWAPRQPLLRLRRRRRPHTPPPPSLRRHPSWPPPPCLAAQLAVAEQAAGCAADARAAPSAGRQERGRSEPEAAPPQVPAALEPPPTARAEKPRTPAPPPAPISQSRPLVPCQRSLAAEHREQSLGRGLDQCPPPAPRWRPPHRRGVSPSGSWRPGAPRPTRQQGAQPPLPSAAGCPAAPAPRPGSARPARCVSWR